MGTLLDLPSMLARLDDDHLFSLFRESDEQGDNDMARACSAEITRRAELPCPKVYTLEPWLEKLLTRLGLDILRHYDGGGGEE